MIDSAASASASSNDAPPDPLATLEAWIADARAAGLSNPNAATLATIDADGRPSARVILVKQITRAGLDFFTNTDSAKAQALSAHPYASLCFHWDVLLRQVRVRGPVTRVSDAEADAYFATRPRESQLGAWASLQSEPCDSREVLLERFRTFDERFAGRDVPRPGHWSGYRVAPSEVELWVAGDHRLHDRWRYTPRAQSGAWNIERLFP